MLPAVGAFLFFGFGQKERKLDIGDLNKNLPQMYKVSTQTDLITPIHRNFPKLGKGYVAFKEALGFKESGGNYGVINQFGYLGKYQFGKSTLAMVGIYNTTKFLNSPELQEEAIYANFARNKWILKDEINRYVGQTIAGVQVTESGILAAAHLAGAGGIRSFLRSGGALYLSDAFGTTIRTYLNTFKGYDTSIVVAERNAKAERENT